MKKLLLLTVLLISSISFAQEDAWVYFNSKPSAATYLANPLTMLTQRALDRRSAQGIALDFTDVPIEQTYIDQVTAASGIQVMAKSKWLNCLHIRGEVADINALSAFTFVDHIRFADASLNSKHSNIKSFKPVNKKLDVQVNYNYGGSANQVQMLKVDWLHQQGYIGTGKIIAVLDAGFPGVDTAQPYQQLHTNNAILGGYDYVNKSTDFYTGNSHGSMVLSTMGGFVSGQLVGTAPNAQYYLFITEDVNSENPVEESNWVEAAEEADRLGVDIITSSLGYFAFDNTAYGHTYEDMTGNAAFASQGANMAFSKGIVVVVSAGNEGETSEPHVGVPAEATHALAIGAVQSNRSYALFSSIGPTYDGRLKPDVMAQGQNSTVSTPSGNITQASGTSFSGPIIAGSIASFWQAVPNLNNQQVVAFVEQSADRYTNPDNQYGYGIPNFQLAVSNAMLNVFTTNKSMFLLYPNPTHNIVNLSFPNGIDTVEMTVYTTLGQLVFKENITQSNAKVSLDSLENGVYLYKIESASFSQSGKIIKE